MKRIVLLFIFVISSNVAIFAQSATAPLSLFTDATCSELRPDVCESEIMNCTDSVFRNTAWQLYQGTYDVTFRIQEYRQYQHPDIMGQINKTNAYSLLDNATGIVARKGEDLVVAVGNTNGDSIRIKIQNLLRPDGDGYVNGSSFYSLAEGINRIKPRNDGLVYVLYHGREAKSDKHVKIHFLTGEVNGYFDINKHEPSQWKTILDKATYELIDVLGEKTHLTFPVAAFKKYTPDGTALVKAFDRIVSEEQHFMGVDKYNKSFNNRQYCHVVYSGYMYAPNYRTAYGLQTMKKVCDITKLTGSALWGPSHEIGHINQVRPGGKWHGMTEVTNNIYCLYLQTVFGHVPRVMKEVERPTGQYDDCWYERSMTEYFTQELPHNANPVNHCRLVPFWQLHLYLNGVKGMDFYADLYELIRNTPDPATDGLCQLEFVKKACTVAKVNLIPFFEKYGFLTPVSIVINDYGKRKFEVTADQVAQTKREIEEMGYPLPEHPFWYISDYTLELFRQNLPVVRGKAAVCKGNTFTIDSWERVVAYEVYSGGKLVFVSPLNHFTVEGFTVKPTDKLYAVAADGTKTEVLLEWVEDTTRHESMGKHNPTSIDAYKR